MRILVTGASGVFGTDLITKLHRRGHEVVALARRAPVDLPRVEFVKGDIRDGARVEKAMVGCDVVAHLAWAVSPLHSADDTRDVNVGGTSNVLEAMVRTGCRRLVFSSSITAYGAWPDNPLFLTEDDPLRPEPKVLYALHKKECEDLILSAGVESVISRTAVVAGRNSDSYAFRIFAGPMLMGIKGASPRWQFVHHDDVGRFHVDACLGERTGIVNVAADDILTLEEMAQTIGKRVATVSEDLVARVLPPLWKLDLVEVDPNTIGGFAYMPCVDTTRLRTQWGFTCVWTGREALADQARILARLVYLGKHRVDLPWRFPWVRTTLRGDTPPPEGRALVSAAPPGLAGELDGVIDPRYSTFTAANLSEAFPGPMTPLSLDVSLHALRGSADGTSRFLGLADDLAVELKARSTPAFGHRLYANVSVLRDLARVMPGWSPEDIDAQYLGIPLPGGTRPRPSGAEVVQALCLLVRIAPKVATFRREVDRIATEEKELRLSAKTLTTMTDDQLVDRISLLHDVLVQHWNIACLANIIAGGVLSALEKAAGANQLASLRGGTRDLVSAAALRAVEDLAERARRDPVMAEALRAGDASPLRLDLERVLVDIGHRGPGETELANPTFGDDPSLLLSAVVKRLDRPARAVPPPTVTTRLRRFTDFAHRSMRERERARDVAIRMTHQLRLSVRQRAERLTAAGVLDQPDDVFYLRYDELLEPPRGIGSEIGGRRAERQRLARLRLPAQFTDHWVPDDAGVTPLAPGELLSGIGASAGVVQGRVRLVDASTMGTLEPGEILVARTTDTGWTPLFAYAAAVVTDVGAMISHQAVVAREFGIPCVVSTGDATVRLRDGELVEVDGAEGTVRLLAD